MFQLACKVGCANGNATVKNEIIRRPEKANGWEQEPEVLPIMVRIVGRPEVVIIIGPDIRLIEPD